MKRIILDGCSAAAHVAYALSDVATIYPITPVASMGQTAQKWAMQGRLNIMGRKLDVRELESELGAAGALHGAAAAGALATTFTASQGLLLMIPNMYKIAGERLPVVFHVGCRSVATHALSIFGDHQDVMACRGTGVAMLASASVQETMDLALVAHLAAIDGSLPVLHFFDGWRTSSEMDTIEAIDYDEMAPLVDMARVEAFRRKGLNPEHPSLRGSAQNQDVYFQNAEAANPLYDAFPAVVQKAMDKVSALTGRSYHTVDYYGHPQAENVMVIMASGAEVAAETVDWLNRSGRRTGVIKVRLFAPFPAQALVEALPASVRTVAVMDRCKDAASVREPLAMSVMTALMQAGRTVRVISGRYGLSSKEFSPAMVKSVFDEMELPAPKPVFTVGIDDDVTHLSLSMGPDIDTSADTAGMTRAIFYAIGNDGTVGGTRMMASVASDTAGLFSQAYFSYSAKKSGGYTVSQLRIAPRPVTSAYRIIDADYVACHKASYVRRFDMTASLRKGGTFVINCPWTADLLPRHLPLAMRRAIAEKEIKLYIIDADAIAASVGLLPRINMPMQTVFLYLSGFMPFDKGREALCQLIKQTYSHEGGEVVDRNLKAVDMAVDALSQVDYGNMPDWLAPDEEADSHDVRLPAGDSPLAKFLRSIHAPCTHGRGDSIPVSAFAPDGIMPPGTTAFEKRRIATRVPVWDASKCVACTHCSLVCPHAAIRPFVLDDAEAAKVPAGFDTRPVEWGPDGGNLRLRIQVYPDDCMGCSSCSLVCPGRALTMTPVADVRDTQARLLDWAVGNISEKPSLIPAPTVNGSQLRRPLLEFSGACAGCGETPYVKLLTQLFGPRLIMANATGCSSIWGGDYPSNPYTTDHSGRGPAWGNSLFEDNAEYAYGILVATEQRRRGVAEMARGIVDDSSVPAFVKDAAEAWLAAFDSPELSDLTGRRLAAMIRELPEPAPRLKALLGASDMFARKTVWSVGGDGWAYDIGFAGLDHVLASGEPVKILVLDTECYSNTGGQTSKATPRSCVAKYSPQGKDRPKKDLGAMMMTYGDVYVASVALGANYQQTITALVEAEAYPGPAIVIAYCPCLNHGIRPGLGHSIIEERRAVESGYWPLYRFDPTAYSRGEAPLTVDRCEPGPDNSGHNGRTPQTASEPYKVPEPMHQVADFTPAEDRYADLSMISPERAAILGPQLQTDCTRAMLRLIKAYGKQ